MKLNLYEIETKDKVINVSFDFIRNAYEVGIMNKQTMDFDVVFKSICCSI